MENKFNILLDELPEEWNGYPIDSDFQTGIQLFWVLEDKGLSYWEQVAQCSYFLFPEGGPENPDEVWEAVIWFLGGWNTDHLPKGKKEAPVMDFQMDQWRLWAAFRQQYGIDLNMEKVHFWAFMGLLRCLNECTFTHVVDIRAKDTSKCTKEEREAYAKAKAMYSLRADAVEVDYTEEEKQKIDKFEGRKRKARAKKEAAEAFRSLIN